MMQRRKALALLSGGLLAATSAVVLQPPTAARAEVPTAALPSFAPLVRATMPAVRGL